MPPIKEKRGRGDDGSKTPFLRGFFSSVRAQTGISFPSPVFAVLLTAHHDPAPPRFRMGRSDLLTDCSDGNEFSLNLERIHNAHLKSESDLKCQKNGWIGIPVLDAHDGLPAHSHAYCKFLLRHTLLEPKDPDAVFHRHLCHGTGR